MADRYCGGYAMPCVGMVVQVDDCTGEVIPGQTGYAFDGVRAVNWEPIIEEAEQASWRDSCGRTVCRNDENCDELLGYTVEMEKCILPFELVNLLTGKPIVTDAGETIGWYDSSLVQCQPRLALLLWSKTLGCTTEVDYKVTVFPYVRFTIPTPNSENDLIEFATLTARADRGYLAGFGEGPSGIVAPLGWDTADPDELGSIGQFITNVDPPIAQCGLITIPAPGP